MSRENQTFQLSFYTPIIVPNKSHIISIAVLFYLCIKTLPLLGNREHLTVKRREFQFFYLLFYLSQPMGGLL